MHEKRKQNYRGVKLYLCVFGIIAIIGCSNGGGGGGNTPPTVKITRWYTENMDESFWIKFGDNADATAFFKIFIEVIDPDGIDDITYVVVINPDDQYWKLRDNGSGIDLYDPERNEFVSKRCHSTLYPNSVLLGKYTAFVQDSAGNEATDTIDITIPGSLITNNGFIYSEDFEGTIDNGINMLKRASIINYQKGEDSITIEFQVDDARVYNGYVWLYDGSSQYITKSNYFLNTINSGSGIFNDGKTNTITIQSSELDLGSYTWEDIEGFHIVLADGAQYSPQQTYFDHYSVSQYKIIFDAEFELNPVTATKASMPASMQANEDDCNTMNINDALADLMAQGAIEDLDKVDISSIQLEYVSGTYKANWAPIIATALTCALTITGSQSTTIAETAINGTFGNIDDTLTQEQIYVINYYLTNRGEEFTYCVACNDADLDTYSVTYNVDFGVRIKGNL